MSNVNGLVQVVTIMQQKLKEWFDYITNPKATEFDPLFVICTFLNLAYHDILDEDTNNSL